MNKTLDNFAEHILAVADRHDLYLVPLHLRIIVYYAYKYALQQKLEPVQTFKKLYDPHDTSKLFYVWRYGPIVPSIYHKYAMYVSDPILDEGSYQPEVFVNLDDYILQLIHKDPFALMYASWKEKFWQDNKQFIDKWQSDVIYPSTVITRETLDLTGITDYGR